MPVHKVGNKWAIGSGKPIYNSKAKANRAYRGYLGSKYAHKIQGGSMIDNKLGFFVPISKFDEEQRMVYGIATCETLDKQNEIVDYAATKEALADYSDWRNIREMHKPSAVGTAPILELRDGDKSLYIGAKIVDDQAWLKCKEGVYKGFSIGGEVLDRRVEINKANGKPINRVTKYVMNEISVVDRPANPSCKFQTVKRDTSIETITITEDPLKAESTRVMEKAITIAKRILSKDDLENLADEHFGLIKIVSDGDKLVKHRQYPMPDKVHAINMIRKMAGADELSSNEKERIHQTALFVLGKSHNEIECPYCISQKLKGGVEVDKKVEKQVTVTEEPKRTIHVTDDKPVEGKEEKPAVEAAAKPAVSIDSSKPNGGFPPVEEKAPIAGQPAVEEKKPEIKVEDDVAAGATDPVNAKLDSILSLLQDLLGTEQEEMGEEEKPEVAANYDEEAKACEEEEDEDEEAKADAKPAEEDEELKDVNAKPAAEEDEACKVAKAVKDSKIKKTVKSNLLKRIKTIVEPLAKENRELKARLEKIEKQPLPRKEAKEGDKPMKVEKYQEVKLEKNEVEFSEQLQKDITTATSLRKSGKVLNKEEETFCQRVADQMFAEKFSK